MNIHTEPQPSSATQIHSFLQGLAAEDPSLLNVLEMNGEITLHQRTNDLFNFLARTIVGQQLSKGAATAIWSRIEKTAISQDASVRDLCSEGRVETILSCGISRNKAKALCAVTSAITYDGLDERVGKCTDYDQLVPLLTGIWGIGTWSADMVAIFFLNMPDIWPDSDAALSRGIRLITGFTSDKSVDKYLRQYQPFRSYIALHTWKAIDSGLI